MVFAVTIAALYFGAEILVPIALAILLSFVLAPTVRYLHKIGLGRAAPVGITVLLAFVIIAGLGGVIVSQLRDLSVGLPRYEATIIRKIQAVKGMSSGGRDPGPRKRRLQTDGRTEPLGSARSLERWRERPRTEPVGCREGA